MFEAKWLTRKKEHNRRAEKIVFPCKWIKNFVEMVTFIEFNFTMRMWCEMQKPQLCGFFPFSYSSFFRSLCALWVSVEIRAILIDTVYPTWKTPIRKLMLRTCNDLRILRLEFCGCLKNLTFTLCTGVVLNKMPQVWAFSTEFAMQIT